MLAGEVGCRYIAPYVNELRVHFEAGFVDHRVAKASLLCLAAQNHYVSSSLRTQVLPASLTHIDEVLALAGVQHITISPGLLQELLVTDVGRNKVASLFEGNTYVEVAEQKGGYGDDEMRWKREFEASDGGEGARKLDDVSSCFYPLLLHLFDAGIDRALGGSLAKGFVGLCGVLTCCVGYQDLLRDAGETGGLDGLSETGKFLLATFSSCGIRKGNEACNDLS